MPYKVEMGLGAASELPQIRPTSLAGSSAITSMLADLLGWSYERASGSLRQHVGGLAQEAVSTGDQLSL